MSATVFPISLFAFAAEQKILRQFAGYSLAVAVNLSVAQQGMHNRRQPGTRGLWKQCIIKSLIRFLEPNPD